MSGNLDITGYAIVSDDDKTAGATVDADFAAQRKGLGALPAREEIANLVVLRGAATNSRPMSTGACVLSFTEAPGLEERPTGGGGTQIARPGRGRRPGSADRRIVAVGGNRWALIPSSMIGFDGFDLPARMGSAFRLYGRSSEPVTLAFRPELVLEKHGLRLTKTMPLIRSICPNDDPAARASTEAPSAK